MADLGGTFDATTVEPPGSYDPIPAGEYRAVITDSEWKDTKAGGRYLNLTWKIDGGEHDGRLVWQMLNLDNANPKAVEIAQRELSAICHATGKINVADSADLHHIPCLIKMSVKRDEQYGDKNEVKGVKAIGGGTAGASSPAARPAQVATPAIAGDKQPPAFLRRAG